MYKNIKFSKKSLLNVLIFIIFPFYSLFFFIEDIFKNKKYAFILLAIFFGLLAYLMVPYDTMDIARHYERFEKLDGIDFLNYTIEDGYYSLELVILMIKILSLPKEFLPFIYIFFTYMLTFSIISKVISDYSKEKNQQFLDSRTLLLFFFFFFVSQLRLIGYTSGLRTGLANATMLYGIFNLLYLKNNIKGNFFIFLSAIIHSSMLLIIPFIFLSNINRLNTLFRVLYYISIVIFITGIGTEILMAIVEAISPYTNSEINILINAYINGEWGIGYWLKATQNGYIYEKFIKPMPIFILLIYLFFIKYKNPLRNIVYLLFLLISLFFEFRTLLDRYGDFLIQLTLLLLLIEYSNSKITLFKKNILRFLLVSFLIIDIGGLWVYREVILPSWSKILYTPGIGYLFSTPDKKDYLKSGE